MNIEKDKSVPLAYIITYRTYASWLHGDARLSVDPKHNEYGTARIQPMPDFQNTMKNLCKETAYSMNDAQRKTVLQSIIDTCQFSQWYLHAAHVRSNHVHVVVKSSKAPEKIAVTFKAYATRYLKQHHPELKRERFWSRGASTGYIFETDFLLRAIQYTVDEQGKEMALYCEPAYYEAIGHA